MYLKLKQKFWSRRGLSINKEVARVLGVVRESRFAFFSSHKLDFFAAQNLGRCQREVRREFDFPARRVVLDVAVLREVYSEVEGVVKKACWLTRFYCYKSWSWAIEDASPWF